MTERHTPDLSVILATPDTFATVEETVRHLRQQTVRDRIEIVLVAPSSAALALPDGALDGFGWSRVVEAGPIGSIGSANAKGIRQATAPVVALAEDHAFPVPEWSEALIAAHRGPYAAVGSVIRNPNNPQSAVAWADCLIGFGEYLLPVSSGVVERLPGNNSSYKRALLLEYGERLESMMETETLLQQDLQRKGHRLYLEAAAQVAHLNFEILPSFVRVKYLSGRVYGAARARGWSPLRRLTFACATPLIPFVRYRRLKRHWDACRTVTTLPRGVMAIAWLGLLISATGELIGCCFGAGRAVEQRERLEFHRTAHLAARRA
jgi:hypothetical protein